MFKKVDKDMNLVNRENKVLNYWKENNIINKCLDKDKQNADRNSSYVFYDGPPTANGKPHIGHVETRSFKDLIPRFYSMKGKFVPRKAGWDTHGLPVEIEVEKQLGINGKEQIEKYGIEPFISKCKENVWKYKQMWEEFSYKVAFFADMDNPYVTYYDDYIESEWWALKQMWDKGLLYKSFKIIPYCPRCGTPLSSHEVAQGYKDIETKTATAKFKVKGEDCYFLAWTTTPWTLPSNLGLCVNPDNEYVKVKAIDGNTYILAKELCDTVFSVLKTDEIDDVKKTYEILETFKGKILEYKEYEPLYDFAVESVNKQKKKAFYVTCDTYVTLDDGTGIVHIAPAFGEDDNKVCQKYDMPFVQFVDSKGLMTKETKQFAGKSTWDADPMVLKDLKDSGKLFSTKIVKHSYPHCWRCDSPLIYYARESWFIKMTAVKDDLIKNNNTINWYPESIGSGRFGDWISNVQDWGISRDRYWGTPLNIWECPDCGHRISIGSKQELREKAIDLKGDVELHRPFIDNVHIKCEKCGHEMSRVKEVIDCWFDSGAMPYAQHHYPFENKELFENQYPADFICEAVDQTRGWFYSLLAESTVLFNKAPFKNCLVLGHVLDKNGIKMSKHLGNTVEPMDALNKFGSDAIRWFFYSNSAPWLPKRYDEKVVIEGENKFLGTLQNVYAFFVLYANIDNFDPKKYTLDIKKLDIMDRWILSELNKTIKEVTEDLENFRVTESSNRLQEFVEELSNWYIRRNRERFWASGMEQDKINCYMTLWTVLVEFSKLIAPFVPFIAEEIYTNLVLSVYEVNDKIKESVHLCDYPVYDKNLIDENLDDMMETTIKISELGRSARNEAKVKNRQPLKKMLVKCNVKLNDYYKELISSELNIKEVEQKDDLSEFTTYIFKPQLKTLGPKYGKLLNQIKTYLQEVDTSKAYVELKEKGSLKFKIDGQDIELAEDDILIEASKKEGFITAIDKSNTVVLETELTEELIEEGFIREIVSKIQTMRKDSNFEVMDKIDVYIYDNKKIVDIVAKHKDLLLKDIMANNIYLDEKPKDAIEKDWDVNDEKVYIAIKK